jgi:hypothetical protein
MTSREHAVLAWRTRLSRIAVDELIAAAALVLGLWLAYQRMRLGVEYSDEAFYAVIAQRFALGDRPYVDEVNFRQTAALFTTPLYWAYLHIVDSTDGVVRFLRMVYLGVQCLAGLVAYQAAKLYTRRRSVALIAATLPLAFVPFGDPAPSYNTLGCFCFAIGTGLALQGALFPRRLTLVLAGVAHACACLAYPPLGLAALVVIPGLGYARPGRGHQAWHGALFYSAGLVGMGLAVVLPLLPGFVSGLPQALAYERMLTRPRTFAKFLSVIDALVRLSPAYPATLATLGVVWIAAKLAPAARRIVLSWVVIGIVWWFSRVRDEFAGLAPEHCLSLEISIYSGLACPLVLALMAQQRAARALLLAGWLPALVAGLSMAVSSDNGGNVNSGLGLLAATSVTLIALPLALASSFAVRRPADGWLGLGLVALIPAAMFRLSFAGIYRERPAPELTTRVHRGPYRGLYTTAANAAKIESMCDEIRPLVHSPGERMLVYYDFPAAYLCAPVRPSLPTSWADSRTHFPAMMPYFHSHRSGHGIVVSVRGGVVSPAFENMLEDPARLLKNGGWYRIYREPPRP